MIKKIIFLIIIGELIFPKLSIAQAGKTSNINSKNVSEEKNNYSIHVERDHQNHIATIYLIKGKEKTDSLLIPNFDGETDSLVNFENKWWLYIFSNCRNCSPAVLEDKHQIILTVDKQRLHLAFVQDFGVAISPYKPYILLESDTNEYFAYLKQHYGFYNTIKLDAGFFNGSHSIEEIFYCATCNYIKLEQEGFNRNYTLMYDERNKIFYTEKKILDGQYSFEPVLNGRIEKRDLQNEEVTLLRFYWACFAYYKGQWYYYNDKLFRSLDIIYSRCRMGCRD